MDFSADESGILPSDAMKVIEEMTTSSGAEKKVRITTEWGPWKIVEECCRATDEDLQGARSVGYTLNGEIEYEFSIQVSLTSLDARTEQLSEERVIYLLDLFNRLSIRSSQGISKRQQAALARNTPEDWWMPPLEPMFVPEECEVISGSWIYLSDSSVRDWHFGLVRWTSQVMHPLAAAVLARLTKRGDFWTSRRYASKQRY